MFNVVLGVIGNDIHVVGNKIIAEALKNRGFRVVNLGTNNKPEYFVDAAIEVNAHAVLIASLNGEGEIWCRDIRARFQKSEMPRIILYAGGNLIVGDKTHSEVENIYKSYGFDRIFYKKTDLDNMMDLLKQDLSNGSSSKR